MGIRYFGEKIEKEVDIVRPASLTITSQDILNLPPLPTEHFDLKNGSIDPKQRKISRKFGGTIRLKQRLSSVPELFIRDYKKKDTKKTTSKKNQGNYHHVSRFEIIKEDPMEKRYSTAFNPLPPPPISNKPVANDTRTISCGSVLINPNYVSRPFAMPCIVSPVEDTTTHKLNNNIRLQKVPSDALMDEIISYYQIGNGTKPLSLQNEIDNVLVTLDNKKRRNYVEPKIIKQESDILSLTSLPILERIETGRSGPNLDALMSSPEYTGTSGSDAWSSSGTEFSDLDSIAPSLNMQTGNSIEKRTLDPCKVRKITLKPKVFTWDEEFDIDNEKLLVSQNDITVQPNIDQFEDSLQKLQDKINNIELQSTRSFSGSSSIYTAL